MAAANTGKDSSNKKAVTKTAQTNKGTRPIRIPGTLIFSTVAIKLMAPSKEDRPAKCKLKIAKSTAPPEWNAMLAKGGYTVQPVPAPTSTMLEQRSRNKEGGSNQKLKLLSRGKAISGAPMSKGTSQLPKPPIIAGITIKKIIKKACAVTITL